jgi:hypothetical protein
VEPDPEPPKNEAAPQQTEKQALVVYPSVVEPHNFYAAPAPGKNFDAAPAPTLLYSKAKFLKRTKVYTFVVHRILYDSYC